ncbi:MAG TPA: hypothetical protein VN660_06370 [Steroidobacteraceae bacterium]|nr:hypothetical protein [Steroidobacteraceae bacterium]
MTSDYKTPPSPGSPDPGSTSSGSTSSGSTPHRHEAWQPRVQKDPPFNAFESDGARSPDARSPSSTIRDPKRDTAPLQGEGDISDSDSLSNEYTPNQDNPTRGGDAPINDRGSQS